MKFAFPQLKRHDRPKIRRRQVKRAFIVAIYAFVAVMTVMSMIVPAFQ